MIHKDIEFHNVVELEERVGIPGLQLQRMPMQARRGMSQRGRWNAQMTPGSEIRFSTDAGKIRLFLSSLEGDAYVYVYQGDLYHSRHYLTPGKIHCLHLEPAENIGRCAAGKLKSRFSPNVWRVSLPGLFALFNGLETFGHSCQPPLQGEKPQTTWLAYGSSITMGTGASMHHNCYVEQTARRLGVDVMNMGQGGACMCEPELADFFASLDNWSFATLEIGINMMDRYSVGEFGERASAFVSKIVSAKPARPVIIITPFLNSYHSRDGADDDPVCRRQREYTKFLCDFVGMSKFKKLFLIDGCEMLQDASGLCADLVHPFDTGMAQIAENLSPAITKILQKSQTPTGKSKLKRTP